MLCETGPTRHPSAHPQNQHQLRMSQLEYNTIIDKLLDYCCSLFLNLSPNWSPHLLLHHSQHWDLTGVCA